MEKGAQSYPGQVLAAGGTLVARGRDANVHGRDESCPQAGRGRDSKSSSLLSRSIYQAEIRRRYVSHLLVLRY